MRLSEGFWLADTACTQALWMAVMGGRNPSHFSRDAQHPVEQVSWDDVQTFLQALQPRLPPGSQAVLPTGCSASPLKWLGLWPPITAIHSAWVQAVSASQKPSLSRTRWLGPS